MKTANEDGKYGESRDCHEARTRLDCVAEIVSEAVEAGEE